MLLRIEVVPSVRWASVTRTVIWLKCDTCGLEYSTDLRNKKVLSQELHFDSMECYGAAKKKGGVSNRKHEAKMLQEHGVTNNAQRPEVRAKMYATMTERCGVHTAFKLPAVQALGVAASLTPESRLKQETTCIERYGGRSPWSSDDVHSRCRATLVERYGVDNPAYMEHFKQRMGDEDVKANVRAGLERSGRWIPLEMLADFKLYQREVGIVTRQQPLSIEWRGKLKKNGLSIDHVYSVYDGFMSGIDPAIVGHQSNLRVMTKSKNCSKHVKSDKTLEQLYEDYRCQQ